MHKFFAMLGFIIALSLPAVAQSQASQAPALENAVNDARSTNGVPTLRIDPRLEASAATHNDYQLAAQCISHQCPGEPDLGSRIAAQGYTALNAWGETVELNGDTPAVVMEDWLASSGHRAALLNPAYDSQGCAHLSDSWGELWTCDLIGGGVPSLPVTSPADQLESLVNQSRVANGATSLHIDSRLQTSAQQKINYMLSSGCYLPRCVNEPTAYERQVAAGYPSTGTTSELIDTQDATADGVIGSWMIDGSGDRFLLLYSGFTDLGCASGASGSTPLWVCDFGQQAVTTNPTATPTPTSTPAPPTATSVPPTATATMFPPTWTSVPPTATVRGTPVPVDQLGECAKVWYADNHGGTKARYIGRMTDLQCVGF